MNPCSVLSQFPDMTLRYVAEMKQTLLRRSSLDRFSLLTDLCCYFPIVCSKNKHVHEHVWSWHPTKQSDILENLFFPPCYKSLRSPAMFLQPGGASVTGTCLTQGPVRRLEAGFVTWLTWLWRSPVGKELEQRRVPEQTDRSHWELESPRNPRTSL